MTDIHTCPLTIGPVSHGSGVVKSGSMTVLINGLPAARMGDVIVEEGGPPNAITSGDPTVIIG